MSRVVWLSIGVVTVGLVIALAVTLGHEKPAPLRIGTNVWVGYEPLHAYAAKGLLSADLSLVEYVSATEVLRAFRNKDIDAAGVTLDEALRLVVATGDVVVVAVMDHSRGADGLVARPGLKHLSELKGARVGVERTGVGAYLLARALEFGGLAPADVVVVPLSVNEHEQAFVSGRVDAVVTFGGSLMRLKGQGANELLNSTQLPGEIIDVLVMRRSVAEENPMLRQTLVDEWFAARQWALDQPQAFAALACDRLQVNDQELAEQLRQVAFPDRNDSERQVEGALEPVARRLAKLMRDHAIVPVTDEQVAALFGRRGG